MDARRATDPTAGNIDAAENGEVSGWAVQPGGRCALEIVVDGQVVGECIADKPRPDIVAAGIDQTGLCGFSFLLPHDNLFYTSRIGVRLRDSGSYLANSFRFVTPALGPKIFFLHIPKTAGTAINVVASRIYSRFQDRLDRHPGWANNPGRWSGYNFLSAHMQYPFAEAKFGDMGFAFVTLLREPVSQLASHINWHANPENHPAENDPSVVARSPALSVVRQLAKLGTIDAQLAAIRAMVDDRDLGNPTRDLFDNCQTRYLAGVPPARPVMEADLVTAVAALHRMAVVGLQERYQESLDLLERYTQAPWSRHSHERHNDTGSEKPDKSPFPPPGTNEIVESLSWADRRVYLEAERIFALSKRWALSAADPMPQFS